ncbi:hypothetical protein SAMN05421835_12227 [Amycolatopsis sacchari]|uniref:Uncharacterized protein n=1 Tax=Amycolatopsis sacchari TaxID=115433 RepID=A0A1I3ZVB7_9PSEU|nr:hypothetical protein SAMN05421835_12227 [Amycolatopsis sacchari]
MRRDVTRGATGRDTTWARHGEMPPGARHVETPPSRGVGHDVRLRPHPRDGGRAEEARSGALARGAEVRRRRHASSRPAAVAVVDGRRARPGPRRLGGGRRRLAKRRDGGRLRPGTHHGDGLLRRAGHRAAARCRPWRRAGRDPAAPAATCRALRAHRRVPCGRHERRPRPAAAGPPGDGEVSAAATGADHRRRVARLRRARPRDDEGAWHPHHAQRRPQPPPRRVPTCLDGQRLRHAAGPGEPDASCPGPTFRRRPSRRPPGCVPGTAGRCR